MTDLEEAIQWALEKYKGVLDALDARDRACDEWCGCLETEVSDD